MVKIFYFHHFPSNNVCNLPNSNPLLQHRIAVADGDGVILQGLVVDGDAIGCAEGIHAAVTAADGVLLLVEATVLVLQHIHDLAGLFRESVLLDQREHCHLDGGQDGRDVQHNALGTVFQLLLFVGMAQHREECAVEADGGLHHIGNIAFIGFRVEVLDLLSRKLLVCAQVKVGAGMDPLQLLEADGEFKFDIRGGIGVMGQLVVVVETVFRSRDAQ